MAQRPADFAPGGDTGRHIEDEIPRLAAGNADGKGAGAEQRFASAPRRHGARCVGKDKGGESRLDRLQEVVGGHSEMGASFYRHHAQSVLTGQGQGLVHGPLGDEETKAVVSVQLRRDGSGVRKFQFGAGIDQPFA